CPEMTVKNLRYQHVPMKVTASGETITVELQEAPAVAITLLLDGGWEQEETGATSISLKEAGQWTFRRVGLGPPNEAPEGK
ncbi:MAG: hypothetical protein IT368_10350, partial [Candidatus Hydrogenedentes bacterium]|nr:hypothetical protein [Candidatus Hydrogenedentota bacterium]